MKCPCFARTAVAARHRAKIQVDQANRVMDSRVFWNTTRQRYSLIGSNRDFSALSTDSMRVGGLNRLLTDDEAAILEEQRDLTDRARRMASQVESVNVRSYSDDFLGDILPTDDYSTFSIVVAGEFNSGKSSLINALLGQKLLETGSLPTTDSITVIAHGTADSTEHNVHGHGGVVLHKVSTVPLLQDLTLIDTPGTNAVLELGHTHRTMKLLPAADLILFVSSADRPFPESERDLLKSIQVYRKNIVVVLNKMDVLETAGGNHGEDEKRRVVDFVADHASELLGARPIVIPISARDAMSAKISFKDQIDQSGLWQRSNFSSLESFLKDTLTTEAKIKSKLTSPIGVTEGMVTECVRVLKVQAADIGSDSAALNLLKSQHGGWITVVDAEIAELRTEISDLFEYEIQRGRYLLDSMTFLDRYGWPMENGRLKKEWNDTSQSDRADLEMSTLERVRAISDLLAMRARAQGQAVIEYLGKRPSTRSQSLVGSITAASRFEDTRAKLDEKLTACVTSTLRGSKLAGASETYLNRITQVSYMAASIQLTALGTLSATALQTVEVFPGLATSAALMTAGSLIVSYGSEQAQLLYSSVWEGERKKLEQELATICSRELQKAQARILERVTPYTRFVETEQERISSFLDECEGMLASAVSLRSRVKKLRH